MVFISCAGINPLTEKESSFRLFLALQAINLTLDLYPKTASTYPKLLNLGVLLSIDERNINRNIHTTCWNKSTDRNESSFLTLLALSAINLTLDLCRPPRGFSTTWLVGFPLHNIKFRPGTKVMKRK